MNRYKIGDYTRYELHYDDEGIDKRDRKEDMRAVSLLAPNVLFELYGREKMMMMIFG